MSRGLPAPLVAVAVVLAAVSVIVFAVRAVDVVRHGALFVTSGAEGPGVYAIWKLLHGYPVYERPDHAPYATSLYNFLFYHGYGAVLSAVGARDGGPMLTAARLLTATFALAGIACQRLLMGELVGRAARRLDVRAFLWSLATLAWIGSSFAKWWPLGVRPDVPSLVFVTLGLLMVVKSLRHGRSAPLVLASVLFWIAWSIKQSSITVLVAACLFEIARPGRRASRVAMLAVPAGVLMAITLAALGDAFRFNLLRAPSLSPLTIRQASAMLGRSLAPNLFVFLWPPIAHLLLRARRGRPRRAEDEPALLLAAATALSFVGCTVWAAKEGSSTNYYYEFYVVAATYGGALAVQLAMDADPARRRPAGLIAAALLATMLVMPLALLARSPAKVTVMGFTSGGALRLVSDEEYEAKARLASLVDALPKPLLVHDDILGQPWHATGDRYPALLLDVTYYRSARERGVIRDGGMPALVAQRRFASLLLGERDEAFATARLAGYREAPLPAELGAQDLVLFLRP